MSKNVLAVIAALFISVGVFAADEKQTAGKSGQGERTFDSRIDSWMEGTIMALDADGKTFSVRGWKLPYASTYAQMHQDLQNKTKNLQGAERQAKEEEVRKVWQDRLAEAKAKQKDRGEPSDFSFSLPDDGKLTVLEGRGVQNLAWLHFDGVAFNQKGNEEAQPVTAGNRDNANTSDEKRAEAAAMMTLKDLKIGDSVKTGYDDGVISNVGYVVVKSDKKADAKQPGAAR